MSYVEKESNKKVEEKGKQKNEKFLGMIFSEDTLVEEPEDIIKTDTNTERKELFKKTYAALLSMFSYDIDQKKKKKKQSEKKLQNEIRVRGGNVPENIKLTVKTERETEDRER